jgi:hypothetical protein
MTQTTTYDVFMDGSCSFCRWTQAKIEPYDSGSRLRFLDYNDPEVAAQAPLFARRTRQRNARSNAGRRVAQRIRSMASLAPGSAKAQMARTLRQYASHALDGALCVRIYRATPLQPSRSARAL